MLDYSVAVIEGKRELCAALQLCPADSGLRVDEAQESVPKLFVLFPLIGSERVGLPVTINSKRFHPREDRDGIVLLGDSTGARENRQLLEESVQHQEKLLEWCAKEQWRGSERLVAFDTTHLPDWVANTEEDQQWFRGLLKALVDKARTLPLMLTPGGEWIEPGAAWLPVMNDRAHRDRLWDLMSLWIDAPAKLPHRDHLASWSRNLNSWAKLLGRSPSAMDEALTTVAVAKLVSSAKSVENLQQQLVDRESLHWLIAFLRLLQEADDTSLFDEYDLLPSQAGRLRRRLDLRRDESISDELKNIAEAFDLNIRNELLNTQVELAGIADLFPAEREPDSLDKLLEHVKEKCRDEAIDRPLAPWVIKLFWWIVRREKDYLDRLNGFPVPTTDEDGDRIIVLYLDSGCEASDRPMLPVAIWPDGAQRFASLFPKRKILAEGFADSNPDQWRPLAEHGYVNMSPLIEAEREMDVFLPDEPLPEADGKGGHKATQKSRVSDLAFLNKPDIGLIDTVRKSKKRATEFIRFLLEFVTAKDSRAFEKVSVACECGQEHKIYRAAWLVPLCRRRWVPLDSSGRRGAQASAKYLAGLLTDAPDIAELLSGEPGEELMRALGISRADLALRVVADDERTRIALIHSMQDLTEAVDRDFARIRELAKEIREHPEIIESIEEEKVRRKKIQRNHDVGLLVEELLRHELEGCGLIVRRTGRGSDFEIESDYIEDDKELWLELVNRHSTTLIEVKSTRVDQVKMSPLQAKEACQLNERFALCVVPLDDDTPTGETVRKRCRVVFGIGEHLRPALARYESLKTATDIARKPHGAIELEITGGQVRFQIGCNIWEDALTFEQACTQFKAAEGP